MMSGQSQGYGPQDNTQDYVNQQQSNEYDQAYDDTQTDVNTQQDLFSYDYDVAGPSSQYVYQEYTQPQQPQQQMPDTSNLLIQEFRNMSSLLKDVLQTTSSKCRMLKCSQQY